MSRSLLSYASQALRFDGVWWRKFAYLGSVYGPEWLKRYSPPGIAAIMFLLVRSNRRGAMANMAHVLGTSDRATTAAAALRTFTEFAYCLQETLEYYSPRPQPVRLDLPEHDVIGAALQQGRGLVIVTGHFGNWDIAAKTLRAYEHPINIVMARDVNTSTQEYVRAARERVGVRIIFSDSSVFSSLNMIRALRQNEIVAIQLDRMLGPRGARLLPFLGAPAAFPAGPFTLARIAGAPLLPVFVPRLGTRHYGIHLGGRVDVPREARDPQALDRVMLHVVRDFEAVVRRFPTQWFQFAPFWPEAGMALAAADAMDGGAVRRVGE